MNRPTTSNGTGDSGAPSGPSGTKRLVGQVLRWGFKGYGFIACAALPRDAWSHVTKIVDPWFDLTRPLSVGQEVEFEPHVLEDGKIQALNVTRPGKFREPEIKGAFATIGDRLAASQKAHPLEIKRPTLTLVPAVRAAPAASRKPGPQTLSEKVQGARQREAAEEEGFEKEEARLREGVEQLQAQRVAAAQEFEERIAELTRERDRKLAQLDEDARRDAAAADVQRAQREATRPANGEGLGRLVREELARARTAFGERIGRQAGARADVAKARAAAIASAGEAVVLAYEEVLRRRDASTDPAVREAFEYAERAKRVPIEAYARALDQESGGPQQASFTLFTSARDSGRLVAVVPIELADLDASDYRWRLGACLFDAAERMAPELDASIGIGTVSGSLAVELRPWSVEADLFEVVLREAWEARPALSAANVALAVDLVPDFEPAFEPVVLEAPAPPEGVASGDVRSVARRLDLNLPDLIASLSASGLPMRDDIVEEGVEESLRELLKGPAVHEAPPGPGAPPSGGSARPATEVDPSSVPAIASRILAKLVRTRRIGSQSTNEASVWGHHFADNQKAPARELVRRLKLMGILITKGGETVSIDPRRMEDVQLIIQMKWQDPGLFEGVE